MSSTDVTAESTAFEYDVAIVGGGPIGCSTGVFTARYGLETAIFDRGSSSIRRCGHLENYLGFPAGIDIETFYGLLHDHAEEAGCTVIREMVESIERTDGGGFVVATQDGRTATAERVVAAARYDAEYLRALGDGAMFVTDEHDGETHERFDREYPSEDGTTPIEGLYVAAPAHDAEVQAIMSAGHGARVGRTILADVRPDRGFPDAMAERYDWVRRESDLSGEWADRERWREWFGERVPDDHGLDEERFLELRERELDRRFDAYLPDDEIDRRTERAHRRLLDHLDDELILEVAREIRATDERG